MTWQTAAQSPATHMVEHVEAHSVAASLCPWADLRRQPQRRRGQEGQRRRAPGGRRLAQHAGLRLAKDRLRASREAPKVEGGQRGVGTAVRCKKCGRWCTPAPRTSPASHKKEWWCWKVTSNRQVRLSTCHFPAPPNVRFIHPRLACFTSPRWLRPRC